jgi:protein-tyrosine-phosphatase
VIDVRSAGLSHHPNGRVHEKAVAVMAEIGIDISHEYSKGLTEADVLWADVIVPMQSLNAEDLREMWPMASKKVRPLGEDVEDPFGGSEDVYRERRDQLRRLLTNLAPPLL